MYRWLSCQRLCVSLRIRIWSRRNRPEHRLASILGKWWHEPSLIIPVAGGFSRREIVLGLADKEGGTHVDPEIDARYQQLMDCGSLRVATNREVTTVNASRLMIGQAGFELLHYLDQHFPDCK
jgi:hypothetical protein